MSKKNKTMKTRIALIRIAVLMVALLGGRQLAVAYYDPGVQRWPNRDPLGDQGRLAKAAVRGRFSAEFLVGANLYQYLDNAPPNLSDPFGESAGTIGFPIIVELPAGVALPVIAVVAAAVCVATAVAPDCDEEWRQAREDCAKWLSEPNPHRHPTGGYRNIEDCARGLVSEACGGNPVDWSKRKSPPAGARW